MTIKLYSWPQSSGTRVAWALEELGLGYEYVALDPKRGDHRAPSYLAIGPHGKVPALSDDRQTVFESGAILIYLGENYGVEQGLWPAGGQTRADALSWTVWAMTELGSYMLQYMYHGLDTPVSYKAADRSKAAAEYSQSQFVRSLDTLESKLGGREYLLGAFSLPDIACASWLMFGTAFGIALAGHPRTAAWLERCRQRPALARAR
jgi:glutathione S-transferase